MEIKEILKHHMLDQVWSWLRFGPLNLPISKHLLMMLIAAFILLAIFPVIIRSRSKFLAPLRSVIEAMFLFVRDDIVMPNLGKKGASYLHYFSTLFFFILICNLLGMVPFGSNATGNISVTATLALTTLALVNYAGIKEQGLWNYIKHIVPDGVPGWIYPLLFPLEILGLLIKTFALCIRLFANMLAGHIIIFSFMGLIFTFSQISPWLGLGVVAPASVIMILFVSLLEIFVAFLQAYIFTFLTAIFTGFAMHPH